MGLVKSSGSSSAAAKEYACVVGTQHERLALAAGGRTWVVRWELVVFRVEVTGLRGEGDVVLLWTTDKSGGHLLSCLAERLTGCGRCGGVVVRYSPGQWRHPGRLPHPGSRWAPGEFTGVVL